MNKVKKVGNSIMRRIIDTAMGNGLMQEENIASGERYITPGIGDLMTKRVVG